MNTANLATFRTRARAVNEAVFPATIQYNGVNTPLAASTAGLKRGDKLANVGFLDEDDITFRVAKALFGALPEVGKHILWVEQGLNFRIEHVHTGSATTLFYKLGCSAKDK